MNGVFGEKQKCYINDVCAKNKVLFVLHVDILKKILKKNKIHAVIYENLFYINSITLVCPYPGKILMEKYIAYFIS